MIDSTAGIKSLLKQALVAAINIVGKLGRPGSALV